ncbi:hypothetical protein M422DRAFT_240651 [Sphaerobolus stellatus SS14]|nr:hypothetical protein M422DRAFT_240651 [Sphaerobolus stellatus SS14]
MRSLACPLLSVLLGLRQDPPAAWHSFFLLLLLALHSPTILRRPLPNYLAAPGTHFQPFFSYTHTLLPSIVGAHFPRHLLPALSSRRSEFGCKAQVETARDCPLPKQLRPKLSPSCDVFYDAVFPIYASANDLRPRRPTPSHNSDLRNFAIFPSIGPPSLCAAVQPTTNKLRCRSLAYLYIFHIPPRLSCCDLYYFFSSFLSRHPRSFGTPISQP